MVAVAAATVGIIYGYDSSNIAGAGMFLRGYFHLSDTQQQWVTTAVVIGEIAGALFGGALANKIGRRMSMILVAATFGVFSLLSGLAWDVPSLVAARLLLGLTVGVSIVVVPVFVAESSAAAVRGALLVMYQVATIFGIILGYLIAWALAPSLTVAQINDLGGESFNNWRWMLAVAAVPAVLITLLLLRLPDTARWYLMKGRREEARKVLVEIEPTIDIEAELDEIEAALNEEKSGGLAALREMARRPYLRATVFVVILGFCVQITGINAIVYYSPQIFKAMQFEGYPALLGLPAVVQVGGLAAVFVSMFLVDRLGRRPVLLSGIGMMVAACVLMIVVFSSAGSSLDENGETVVAFSGALTAFGFIGVLLFTMGFSFGFGALVWVYAGESFPSRLRSIGASAMLTSDLVANVIVGAVFLTMLNGLGGAGTFGVLGGFAVLSFVFVFLMAPETKGRPLEDIRHYWENGGKWPAQVGHGKD